MLHSRCHTSLRPLGPGVGLLAAQGRASCSEGLAEGW